MAHLQVMLSGFLNEHNDTVTHGGVISKLIRPIPVFWGAHVFRRPLPPTDVANARLSSSSL